MKRFQFGHSQLALVMFAVTTSVAIGTSSAAADEPSKPIALHPENSRYFLWKDRPTILVTSGEHYGALLNRAFDYGRYFDELAAHGLNHTRLFTGVYRETPASFGITDNTLAPVPGQFVCPWARGDHPGESDGGNKFDLTRWDAAYFERLHDLMNQARKRGIVVELALFCPLYDDDVWKASPLNSANNSNLPGEIPRTEVFTLKHSKLLDVQLALTRKLVYELRDYDNLYYEVCNEPYFAGVTMEWQHQIVDTIVAAEKGFPHPHLISMNIANGRAAIEKPHPAVSIFNFHYCVPPDTVGLNYGLNKVIGENETGFRGKADLLYRTEGWDFLIAGGALYNNLDYSFTAKHPKGTFLDYRSPGGGSVELRQQLGILKTFLENFDLIAMKPDDAILKNIAPAVSARALVQRGKAYAIYIHAVLPNKATDVTDLEHHDISTTIGLDLSVGEYKADWMNTRTGKVDATEQFTHQGGLKSLTSPSFLGDIALRIVSRKR